MGKIPWRRKQQPTPKFLPRESHGQRNLMGYTVHGVARVEHDLTTNPHMPGLSCGMWNLVPRPGIEPKPPALEARSLNHWTAREFPDVWLFKALICTGHGAGYSKWLQREKSRKWVLYTHHILNCKRLQVASSCSQKGLKVT